MKKIIVLGAGLVGGVMAVDLSIDHNVTSVDISKKNLDNIPSNNIKKICQDISDKKLLQNLIKDYDLVIGAVPGFMGYKMMKDVIEAGKNIVDISFIQKTHLALIIWLKKIMLLLLWIVELHQEWEILSLVIIIIIWKFLIMNV